MIRSVTQRERRALPPHCSPDRDRRAVDWDLFRTRHTAVGSFRCGVNHVLFPDSGPASECLVVFPRSAVWIRHEGAEPFLADPATVTMYNRGQLYRRMPASPEGDRCDWFAVSDDLAREIVGAFSAADGESDRPFRFASAQSAAALYVRQRVLVRRAAAGRISALELDESIIAVVTEVLGNAYRQRLRLRTSGVSARHAELAERTKAELALDSRRNASVTEIAARVGVSPFHLCRVFRSATGMTMHDYRRALRVRHALERLGGEAEGAASLSQVAHDMGFASHSHFVREMRRAVGASPSMVRATLSANAK